MSEFLVFSPVLLGCFSENIPKGIGKVTRGGEMQTFCDLRYGNAGADQHHFGPLYPYVFDIGADRDAHFLLEFSGQIIFGVPHLFGEGAEFQFLLRVEFNIVPATADLGGNIRVCPVFPYPENEVLIHGEIQRG